MDAYYLHQKRASVDLALTLGTTPSVTREAARNPQCKHCLGKNLKAVAKSSHETYMF